MSSSSSSSSSPVPGYQFIYAPDFCSCPACSTKTDPIWQSHTTSDPQGAAVFSPSAVTGGGTSVPVNPSSGGYVSTEYPYCCGCDCPEPGESLLCPSSDYSNLPVEDGPSGDEGNTGNNWYNSLMPSLTHREDPSSSSGSVGDLIVYTGLPRRQLYFRDDGSGTYTPLFHTQSQLTRDNPAGTFTVTGPDGTRVVFENEGGLGVPGKLLRFILPNNAVITAAHDGSGRLTSLTRVMDETTGATSGYYFAYTGASRRIDSITLKLGGVNARRVNYTYYGASDANGMEGDQKLMVQEIFNQATGAWEETGRVYYRYYTVPWSSEPDEHGFEHGLKFRLNAEGWRRMFAAGLNPETASDAELTPYSHYYLEYENVSQRIARVLINGTEDHKFTYVPGSPLWYDFTFEDFNQSVLECTHEKPDGNEDVYYANEYRQCVFKICKDGGTNEWLYAVERDFLGRAYFYGTPTAIASYSTENTPIPAYTSDAGLGWFHWWDENSGHLSKSTVSNGGYGSTEHLIFEREFVEQRVPDEPGGVPVWFLSSEKIYADPTGVTPPAETTYEYEFPEDPDTYQMKRRKVTLPVIATGQNGDGVTYTRQDLFDINGKVTWSRDPRGFLTAYFYDPITLALTRRIDDVDTAILPVTPTQSPAWTTPSGGGLHLISDFENDAEGRTVQVLGPRHVAEVAGFSPKMIRRANWTVRLDAAHETRTAQGYVTDDDSAPNACVMNPIHITRRDAADRVTDQIEAMRTTCGCGAAETCCDCEKPPLATGSRISAREEFPQKNWSRWQSFQYDDAAKLISQRLYFNIPDFGAGQPVFNYAQTEYGYDADGRQNMVKAPGGTITFTTYTAMGWVEDTWIGTDIGDGEPPFDGGNMVKTATRAYDISGNQTSLTLYVSSAASRITYFSYDWRNRRYRVQTTGMLFYDLYELDNLDRVIVAERWEDLDPADELLAKATTAFDDMGRVYNRSRFSVESGTAGDSVSELFWYDPSGNTTKHRPLTGRAFEKMSYNGMNWTTARYLALNDDDDDDDPPGTVEWDIVVQQSEPQYDAAGNVIFQTVKQRFHDAPTSGTGFQGPLQDVDSQPKARVSFVAMYPDPLGRTVATANYGTNGSTVVVRSEAIPEPSDTCLVSRTIYNARGEAVDSVDANGIITRQEFDDAGRLVKTIENLQQ